jgi:hypothetical protein
LLRLRRSRRAIGPIDGRDVEKVIAVPGSPDSIVLLDAAVASSAKFANLIRVRPDGAVVWRATPPDTDPQSADAWVAARWRKRGRLSANSWSCYLCEIDPETGATLSATFTK